MKKHTEGYCMEALSLVSSAARGRQGKGRLKGPVSSGRFVPSALAAPAKAESQIADLAQAVADAPEVARVTYQTVQDLLKKGVEGAVLETAQAKLRAAREAAGGGAMRALFMAIVAVKGMTDAKEGVQKRCQRDIISYIANRVKPTATNPEPVYTVQSLYAIGETLKKLAPKEEGKLDLWAALRYETGKAGRMLASAIMIADLSGFEFSGNSNYLDEVAELTLGYLKHWLAVAEEQKGDKALPASARESVARAALTIRDRIAVLKDQLPAFVVESWQARAKAAEMAADKAEVAGKSQTKPVATPTPVAQVTETSPTLADLEEAVDDDSPLGAFAALMAKLGITGETEVYLRPVEEALRAGDPVSAEMSLTDVLTNFGELMPDATREGLSEFRKALAE